MGHSMTHLVYESVLRDNMILATIDRSIMKTSRSLTWVNKDNLDNPTDLELIEDNQVIGLKDMAQQPRFDSPAGFNKDQLLVADRHHQDAYEMSGIPEGKAGSKAEPGVPSAIGQRNVAAFVNKRFASVQTRYVQFTAVDIAELDVRAMHEVYEREGSFSRKWPGGPDFFEEVDAEVLDLDESKYTIQAEAVGGSKNTPQDRVQTAYELWQAGSISEDAYAIAQQDYDTPGQIEEDQTQKEWLKIQMYNWCFSSDEQVDDPNFYKSPLKFMNLEAALLQTIDGLMQAQIDELEDERMEFFMLFLSDLDAQLKARAQFTASITPQQPQLPVGAPPMAQLPAA
jgi:hypothetical protein